MRVGGDTRFSHPRPLPLAAAALGSAVAGLSPVGALVACVALAGTTAIAFAPVAVGLSVLPASYLTYRLPGGIISVADAVLVAGVLSWLPRMRTLQRQPLVVGLSATIPYLLGLFLVLLANPTFGAGAEFAHRIILVSGSLFVGYSLAANVDMHRVFDLFHAASILFASAAIAVSLQTGLTPAYPLGLSKNHVGGLLAVSLVTLTATHRLRGVRLAVAAIVALGLVATQARAAVLSVVVGLIVIAIKERRIRRETVMFGLLGVLAAGITAASLSDDQEFSQAGSVGSRLSFQQQAFEYWQESPAFGQGIRFYMLDEFYFPRASFANDEGDRHPHSLVTETLAESGVVGAVGLIITLLAAAWLLRGRDAASISAFSALTVTVFIGLFDIFWLAGRTTAPFLLIGFAIRVRYAATPLDFGEAAAPDGTT